MVFADSKNILDKDPTETQKISHIFVYTRRPPGSVCDAGGHLGYTRGDPALPDLLRWDIQHHQVRVYQRRSSSSRSSAMGYPASSGEGIPEVIQLFQIFSESNEISSIIMCISWSVSLTMYHLPRNYSYSTVQCTCCRFCFAVSMFFLFLGLDRRCRQRTLFLLRCPSSTWPTSATVIGWTW